MVSIIGSVAALEVAGTERAAAAVEEEVMEEEMTAAATAAGAAEAFRVPIVEIEADCFPFAFLSAWAMGNSLRRIKYKTGQREYQRAIWKDISTAD